MRVKTGRVLKPWVQTQGYHIVTLYIECVRKHYRVHRLVALAFLENPDSKKQVNHIDWVKTNNSISNLEWSTWEENIRHSVDVLGNQHWVKWENNPMYGKLWVENPRSKTVVLLTKEWVEINRYGSIIEASRETGVNNDSISKACRWIRSTAGRYKWAYA